MGLNFKLILYAIDTDIIKIFKCKAIKCLFFEGSFKMYIEKKILNEWELHSLSSTCLS